MLFKRKLYTMSLETERERNIKLINENRQANNLRDKIGSDMGLPTSDGSANNLRDKIGSDMGLDVDRKRKMAEAPNQDVETGEDEYEFNNSTEANNNDLPIEQVIDMINNGSEEILEIWTPSHESSFVVSYRDGQKQDVFYSEYFAVVCRNSGINHTTD